MQIALVLLILGFFFAPIASSANGDDRTCSSVGYTILTLNGIFTNEEGAKSNKRELERILGRDHNNEPIKVDYLHNPSHLGGLGDLLKVVYQGLFDSETVEDYDLAEMLKDASEKVKTQKILLVAHSQGNFYANSMYDVITGGFENPPVALISQSAAPRSIAVYSVATPSGRVAGGGKWLTSDTDKVIADIVGRGLKRPIMPPNTHIELQEGDPPLGHKFSEVYLKYRGQDIVSDIGAALNQLQPRDEQNTNDQNTGAKPCISPPRLGLGHTLKGIALAIADPIARGTGSAVAATAGGIYKTGSAIAQAVSGIYALAQTTLQERVSAFRHISFNAASALYGSSVTLEDLEEEPSPMNEVRLQSPLPEPLSELTPPKNVSVPVPPLPQTKFRSETDTPDASLPPYRGLTPVSTDALGNPVSKLASKMTDAPALIAQPVLESVPEATSTPAVEIAISTATSTASSWPASSGGSWGPEPTIAVILTPVPSVSLSITQCSSSLSPSTCLTASTTLSLVWSSSASNLSHFNITCTISGTPCSGFSFSPTTATSTTYTVPDDTAIYTFSAVAVAGDNQQSTPTSQSVEVARYPVVINEIAWAGTSATRSADEWIELHNPTSAAISLTGWVLRSHDNTPYIPLAGSIPAGGYIVLERTNDDPVSDIIAHQTYTGALNNTPEHLILSYASTTIDQSLASNTCGNFWCYGDSSTYKTMERYLPESSGTDISNWSTFATLLPNGTNADGLPIAGTPGRRNSINYYPSLTTLTQHTTLTTARSPYIGGITVPAGITLTIDPGVVIKMPSIFSSFLINGSLMAGGTSSDPIIITSLKDDTYAGDTNGDGSATSPSPGDWASIKITSSSASSTLSHTIIRYGGVEDAQAQYAANLRIENASTIVSNSIIEKSHTYGIWMKQGGGSITNSTISENNRNIAGQTKGIGILLEQSSPILANNTITQNTHGLWIYTASNATVTNNTFSSNTLNAIESANSYPTFSQNTATGNGTNGIALMGVQTQDYSFSANLPYIGGTYTVNENTTLTLPAGTIWKSPSGVTIRGTLNTTGTLANPVIFTSIKDDAMGGDTNGDGTTTSPSASDWTYLSFIQNQATSTLTHTTVKYGGGRSSPSLAYEGALRISGASLDIRNSTIQYNGPIGVWMAHATSTIIADSIIEEHRDTTNETFYGLFLTASSTPTVSNTTFRNNEQNVFADGTSTTTDGGGNTF